MTNSKRELQRTPAIGSPPWSATPDDVARFVARYGHSYDPEADDYSNPGAFAQPVSAGKNSAIYNAHSYHTKVPPDGIKQYLEHYTHPGDLILDPFCGSGMTGVACVMTGRIAILNDLSPAATHIAYNYCIPVDVPTLRREWERIRDTVREEFDWLYGTTCDRCNNPATIQYMVLSDVFRCKMCGKEIVLWDVGVVRELTGQGYDPPLSGGARPGDTWKPPTTETAPPKKGANGQDEPCAKGDVLDVFQCPHCGKPWHKTQLDRVRAEPVLTVYDCPHCGPHRNQHPTSDQEKKRIADINAATIPYWYPTTPFESTREMWRGVHRDLGITRVCDFWTKRNLWATASLYQKTLELSDERIARELRFAFTACLLKTTVTTRFNFWRRGNSNLTGTLYVGSFTVENHVGAVYERKLVDIIDGAESMAWLAGSPIVVTQHAGQDMPLLENSVDYIFTDPPFGSNIFYSDVNLLWEAWLGYLTDQTYEAVWNKSRKPDEGGKTLEDYHRLMAGAFVEMHRLLKPGRWASVVFHNSDDRVWDAIRDSAQQAGFTIENVAAFDKQQKSFKGIKGEKGLERVSNLDIVLNLRKPASARQIPPRQGDLDSKKTNSPKETGKTELKQWPKDNGDGAIARQAIGECIEQYLREVAHKETKQSSGNGKGQDPRGVQAIHSQVIQMLINYGRPTTGVSMTLVVQVLQDYCKQVDGRWYLPGEEVRSRGVVSNEPEADPTSLAWAQFSAPKDEASAIEWVRAVIRSRGPQLEGDVIDQFRMAAPTLKLAKEFRRVLEENFTFDQRRGRWRLPTSAEAEAKLSIKVRLLEGRVASILDGSSTPPDTEGLGQLLEDCFEDGLYQQTYELWTRINSQELLPERRRVLAAKARVAKFKALPAGS